VRVLPFLLGCLSTFALLAAPGVRAQGETGDGIQVVETEHYRLHYEGPAAEAEEAGRVLEAAWPLFRAHFGAEPKLGTARDGTPEKLVMRFSATREQWVTGIRADGTWPPQGAGGYYWPVTKTAHLYRQPTTYFTRALLIHEAAHQFHYLARTRNRAPAATWYTEGVAEHLCWHRWDGTTLVLGVIPGVSLKDYPALALKEMRAQDFDMKLFVDGKVEASRAVGWALYTWLATGQDGKPMPKFDALRRKMDAGARPSGPMKSYFGDAKKLHAQVLTWLEQNQSPWAQGFNEWEQIDTTAFRGHAGVVTVVRRKARTNTLGATLEVPAAGRWRGGLLLHWTSADDYTVAMLDGRGGIQVNRRQGGRWNRLHRGRIRRAEDARVHDLVAVREGASVSFWIDGDEIGAWALPPGPMGLSLESCDLRFRGVDAQ
jgi:hypothetical protein